MPEHSFPGCTVVNHSLVAAKLAVLRDRNTSHDLFRRTLRETAVLIASEALRDIETVPVEVETPLTKCPGVRLARPVVIIPILRAGLGMMEGILEILPDARVGHVGLYRDEVTFEPRSYYFKAPLLEEAEVLIVDPMLATGHSACDAASKLKAHGARRLRLINIIGSVQGVACFRENHPDIPNYLGTIDPSLDEKAYIVPGLGDAGDRYFGT